MCILNLQTIKKFINPQKKTFIVLIREILAFFLIPNAESVILLQITKEQSSSL